MPQALDAAALAASASAPALDASVATTEDLMARLRAHAEVDVHGRTLPVSVGTDWAAAVEGTKPVVAEDHRISFACTACGDCCRSFSNSIMLDTYDVFMMSRSEMAREGTRAEIDGAVARSGTTRALHELFGDAFVRRSGVFDAEAVLVPPNDSSRDIRRTRAGADGVFGVDAGDVGDDDDDDDDDDAAPPMHGLAPVLFMRARSARTGDAPGGGDVAEGRAWQASVPGACHFAVPLDNESGEDQSRGRLKCSLGRRHMPTACQLYPLGELWSVMRTPGGEELARAHTSRKAASDNPDRPLVSRLGTWSDDDMRHFFTVDSARCEGVNEIRGPSGSTASGDEGGGGVPHGTTSLAEYRGDANDLPYRREQWEWFKQMATLFAVQQYDAQLLRLLRESHSKRRRRKRGGQDVFTASHAVEVINDVMHRLWYDFDSLPVARLHGASWGTEDDWPAVRDAVEQGTLAVTAELERFVRRVRDAVLAGDDKRGFPSRQRFDSPLWDGHVVARGMPWWFPLFLDMYASLVSAGVAVPLWTGEGDGLDDNA